MKIQSPLSGIVTPLSQVPDDAFAQKMVGDGIAIDPTSSILLSPIDGMIEFIHPSHHAVTLKSSDNTEVLIHIGIDTVKLRGEGFKSRAQVGQKVKVGDPLIEFDLDFITTQAKSPMTLVLVTQHEKYDFHFTTSGVVKTGSPLFEIDSKAVEKKKVLPVSLSTLTASPVMICQNVTGLHARPAAVISQVAQKFQSEILIFKNNKSANAKSVTSILSLGIEYQDQLIVEAFGTDSETALAEIRDLIQGLSEEKHTPVVITDKPKASLNKNEYHGVVAASGQVYGEIYQFQNQSVTVDKNLKTSSPEVENKKLNSALAQAKSDLQTTIEKLHSPGDLDKKTIYQAHLELLNDPEIYSLTTTAIIHGSSAEYAWQESINQLKKIFKALNNQMMAERAHDLHDVGQRVLKIMLGVQSESTLNLNSKNPVILVARNLTPSDMSLVNPEIIKGICTVEGGASSHVAIIARSIGVSMVTALDESVLQISNNTEAILYAQKGFLKTQPAAEEIKKTRGEIERQAQQHQTHLAAAQNPATTRDGHSVEVFANIGKNMEVLEALKNGAEGVGLLRSEFLFLDRSTAPTEQEQTSKYQEIIEGMKGHPVIIRTLDVGGDKPLSYLPMPAEENPFLGVRGLRLSLKSEDMFRLQLRSLLKVNPVSSLKIMFPMVTTLSEFFEAKKILLEETQKLGAPKVDVGIMIEVPSAALMAETFAPHVDFFSIGSNDLTQYTLAVDRGHRDLAAMADGLHPSVLRLIKITCDAAKKYNKMVGVCGGIASDAHAIPLLIGLGVDELSVSVPTIPQVKAQIRNLNKSECTKLAETALNLAEARHVRETVQHLTESL